MECEWPKADFRQQVVLAISALLFGVSGWRALKRNRPRWIPVWLAGLLGWMTVPKYFICARCENYGKSCDFFYGGRYAALLFQKSDKPFNAAGYLAEGTTLAVFQFLPAIAARRDRGALALYLLSGLVFQAVLIVVCCVKCVANARDPWKRRYCPTYKLVEAAGLAEPTPEARET
ncbi:MAG: hypothetical protein V1748_02015 [Actinomycetota bacterium]